MSASAFTFYRGGALIMASDLSKTPTTGMTVQAYVWTLAHAHARTGDRFAIAAYLGDSDEFDKAIVKFARAYADQNELDYQRFMEALEAGEFVEAIDTAEVEEEVAQNAPE